MQELKDYGIECLVHDPMANSHAAQEEYGIALSPLSDFENLDALILAVNHRS